MLLGSGGASRIPFILAQVIHASFDGGRDLEAVVASPRFHVEHGILQMEKGWHMNANIDPGSLAIKIWHENSLFFGGVHAIRRKKDGWEAVGDERREGFGITVNG